MENENTNFKLYEIFNKKFKFSPDESWILPENLYKENKYDFEEFQRRKLVLNSVKEQLNSYDLDEWSKHTKNRDPSTLIIKTIRSVYQLELITQAWCKFYECLSQYNLISEKVRLENKLNTLHLCEAPGAFICALNHYIKTFYTNLEWNWLGMSLNPNYEGNSRMNMIPDDRLMHHTLNNWFYGDDLTGDLTKYYNHTSLINKLKDKNVQLITADGSIDCMSNPGDQESIVEYLHYCEIVTALKILSDGGNFIIKMFTMFETNTISMMYLLNCCFKQVCVFKPVTSKSGNSEIYIICLNYLKLSENFLERLSEPYKLGKITNSLFKKTDLNENFIKQLYFCTVYFSDHQIKTINENILHFKKKKSFRYNKFLKNKLKKIVGLFLNETKINFINFNERIVKDFNLNQEKYTDELNINYNPDFYMKLKFKSDFPSISIKTGKFISVLNYSKYHGIKNYDYYFINNSNESSLFNLIKSSLNFNGNLVISPKNFNKIYGVSEFHKIFFEILTQGVKNGKNLIIIGLPLLTNFSVGLLYLISIGFEAIWFVKNVIVLKNIEISSSWVDFVKTNLNRLSDLYLSLSLDKKSDFVKDILQIVDVKDIHSGVFYECVCHYNVNVLKNRF